MNRKTVVETLPDFDGREIVISDIHGNLRLYNQLLEEVDYQPGKDRLILLGDYVEKGRENLALLRRIMKQFEEENVVGIMGNCDFVAKNILFSYRLDFLKDILLKRKHSLIHEMIQEAGLEELNEETDMQILAMELRNRYLKELSFLNDLPHVLVDSRRIFAHAGIADEKDFDHDFRTILTYPLFAETPKRFEHMVIVGHMPVSEYSRHRADFNPRFFAEKNIYSIDGGNEVKHAGQLNALIFQDQTISTHSVSDLPYASVIHSTAPKNPAPFFINWNRGEIELVEKGEKQSRVYSPYLHRYFWIDNDFLQENKGTDFTNYEMPLRYGEKVEIVCQYGSKVQVKKQGIMGWTQKENLQFDN